MPPSKTHCNLWPARCWVQLAEASPPNSGTLSLLQMVYPKNFHDSSDICPIGFIYSIQINLFFRISDNMCDDFELIITFCKIISNVQWADGFSWTLLSSDIWALPSEMSDVSDDFGEHWMWWFIKIYINCVVLLVCQLFVEYHELSGE